MLKNDLIAEIGSYFPIDSYDQRIKDRFLEFIANYTDIFNKQNVLGHITVSAIIVNKTFSKLLLLYHKKLGIWIQPGGHIENDSDLLIATIRETIEETSLKRLQLIDYSIFDLDIHRIPANKLIEEHFHYDIRFIFQKILNEDEILSTESSDLKWVTISNLEKIGRSGFSRIAKKINLFYKENHKLISNIKQDNDIVYYQQQNSR